MADENDLVSKAMVDALNSMRTSMTDLALQTKMMVDAISSMVKPLKEASDLSKAIKEHNKDAAKAHKEISEEEKKQEELGKKIKAFKSDEVKAVAEILFTSKDLSDEGKKYLEVLGATVENAKAVSDAYKEVNIETAKLSKDAIDRMKGEKAELGLLHRLSDAASKYVDTMAAKGKVGAAASGTFAEVFTGGKNIKESISSIGSSLMSLLPTMGSLGGLLGLIISGKVEDAKFAAIGQISKQAFDTVGGASAEFGKRMVGLSRDLSKAAMINVEDLAAVSTAFAQTGVRASAAQAKIEGFSNEAGNDLMAASLSMDKALELPAGTMVKLSGTMAQMFNTSAKESFITLTNIGHAAMDAGGNMTTFMQQAMDAASALRLLNANGLQVADMQYKLMQTTMGHLGPGSAVFAQQYAAAGAASAAQSIGGLGVGLSAIVGEKLGYGSGLDAWYGMKSPNAQSRGGKQIDPEAVAMELAKIAQGATSNRSEQVYMLQQLTGSTTGGAEAMLDIGKAMEASQKPSEEQLKMMKESLRSESEKTSSIDITLAQIKDGLQHIGSGFLAVIISSLKLLHASLRWGIDTIVAHMPGTDTKYWEGQADKWAAIIPKAIKEQGLGVSEIELGAKKAKNAALGLIGGTLGSGWSIDEPNISAEQIAKHERSVQQRANRLADEKARAAASTAAGKPRTPFQDVMDPENYSDSEWVLVKSVTYGKKVNKNKQHNPNE